MSTAKDDFELRLVGAAATAGAALTAAERLIEYRDRVIRDARNAGLSAIKIAELTQLSRPRVYVILNSPDEESDWWDHEAFEQELDDRWGEAIHEWEESGQTGKPEDYFPLGGALSDAL